VAICFANGEVFSNLAFTQALHDTLKGEETLPLDTQKALASASDVYKSLMDVEPVSRAFELIGKGLDEFLADVTALYQDEKELEKILNALDGKTRKYAENIGTPQKGKNKGKGKKGEE
jgi:CRISPR-associated protein Csc2